MQRKTILIVGIASPSRRQYLNDHNTDFILLRDVNAPFKTSDSDTENIPCDFSDPASLDAAIAQLQARGGLDGVMTSFERYVRTAAYLADRLGLAGLPLAAAEACTDKFIMRQKFATAPRPISPDFAVVTSEDAVREFAANHAFPLILKPANLSKSLLVFKNNDLDELLAHYQHMTARIDAVYDKYAHGTTPKVVIEEFMEGSVHSVDAFVDSAGEPHVLDAIVDYQTGYDIGFADNFHYSRIMPTTLPDATVQAIRETAAMGCRALGMRSSPAHVEIILTADGPRIVEIGARNGGYRERMHSLANGIDIMGNALKLAYDEPLDITPLRNDSMGAFELFPRQTGAFTELKHAKELQELPSFHYLSIKAKPGTTIGTSSDGYKTAAVVMLHNADPEQFARDRAFLDTQVEVLTEPVA